MFEVPVLFLTFNRLDTAKQVFGQIKKQQPTKLFFASDGPRNTVYGEKEKVEEVRNWVLSQIDWDCEVKTLFRDENLGCGKAVSSAISWFFENVEYGIILEDDCMPSDSFFVYCETLLKKYMDNPRIMHIAGNNPLEISVSGNDSYYFSKIQQCWGWASWRRAWQHFEYSISNTDDFCKSKRFKQIFRHSTERSYWKRVFGEMAQHKINTWDYQWVYAILKNCGICINPCKNLISNLGFSADALHTADVTAPQNNMKRYEIGEITHPTKIEYNEKLCDAISERQYFIVIHNIPIYRIRMFYRDYIKPILKKILSPFRNHRIKAVSVNDVGKDLSVIPVTKEELFTLPINPDINGKYLSSLENLRQSVTIPQFNVYLLKNGIIENGLEEIYTTRKQVIAEITSLDRNPQIGEIFSHNKRIHINGSVAYFGLSYNLASNYYHFSTEYLMRYFLLIKANIEPDYYILEESHHFQKQYYELLGIPTEKILHIKKGTLVQADTLIFTSMLNNSVPDKIRGYDWQEKRWLPSFYSQMFTPVISKFNVISAKRVYISRNNSPRRIITNEKELVDLLHKYKFEKYYLEDLSVEDQISLFHSAECVVAPHGAGLVNLVYSNSDTTVLEIFPQYYHDNSFYLLANNKKMPNYHYYIAETPNIQNTHPQNENITVDINIVENFLKNHLTT
ncbi:MAG: glycosyltransferase family 61 protein [Spirochaetaceae bacterium]|nr:glycosyltransferase family 61 protein [Spirochaetaceae bacterium]